MKKLRILLAAVVAVLLTACVGFKVEATVNVTVVKDGQPLKGVQVYRFNDNGFGESTTYYKSNAKDVQTTNAKGVAHFDLKSPEDLEPSDAGIVETQTFYFATYNEDDKRNAYIAVEISTGDKKQVTLEIKEDEGGGDRD